MSGWFALCLHFHRVGSSDLVSFCLVQFDLWSQKEQIKLYINQAKIHNIWKKMATKFHQDVDKLLECSVCLEQIKQPKMLTCQHTFCLDPCLIGLVKRSNSKRKKYTVECPICREKCSFAEWLIILNSKAHLIWPKSAQKGAQYFFPKKSHIFGKRRTIFDPPNNFYCIFIHEFFGDAKF